MALKFTRPKGTLDVLPDEAWKWQYVEDKMRAVAHRFGFKEIRIPTFESTELYARGVGEGTDVVSKEMYTFTDKGGRSVTLRPEGTAGVVRAVLENGLLASSPLPLKAYYIESHFRYENVQKGRYREHHQFGVECLGARSSMADVEIIQLAAHLLRELGMVALAGLEVNTIGCNQCRPAYHAELRKYFGKHRAELCDTCRNRLELNPMRILDCKEEKCAAVAAGAPTVLEYICESCRVHFDEVRAGLDEAGLAYRINPSIVRGLDYYTNTVFEFVAGGVGTQGTVCGGGRYDGLIEELGASPAPAVGFGMGIERLLMLLTENGRLPSHPLGPALYAAASGQAGQSQARHLTAALRSEGLAAECDLLGRSVKAQMRAADRMGALYTVVLGQDELESGIVRIKRMRRGDEAEVPLVGLVAALKYALAQDPAAVSDVDLHLLFSMAGPMVTFEEENKGTAPE